MEKEQFHALVCEGRRDDSGRGDHNDGGHTMKQPPQKNKNPVSSRRSFFVSTNTSFLRLILRMTSFLIACAVMVWLCRIVLFYLFLNHNDNQSDTYYHHDGRSHWHPNNGPSALETVNGSSAGVTMIKMNNNPLVEVPYECPAFIDPARNDKDHIFDFYSRDTHTHANFFSLSNSSSQQPTNSNNTTANITIIDKLLDMKYGSWGITPRQRKALNARWVDWYAKAIQQQLKQQPSNTKNNGNTTVVTSQQQQKQPQRVTIYESACGVGLTLFVILQLLQEHYNITGLQVYGNEYIEENVVTANQFYDSLELEQVLNIQKGRICRGDSTNLSSFVPSNAFDVVMTGYIDPIADPLNLHLPRKTHKQICKSNRRKHKKLMQQEQALIEDWFAAWTTEMVRIAKPGATIILESISKPRCQVGDWGGVDPNWWASQATHTKYGWAGGNDDIAIDPASVETMAFDPQNRHKGIRNRYNVRMVKAIPKQ